MIEDFLKLHEKMVVIGYERFASYVQTLRGMIYYWEGNKGKAEELLGKLSLPYKSPRRYDKY
ncbi:MAG: hypothetical protein ACPLPS_09880 [bacterium]